MTMMRSVRRWRLASAIAVGLAMGGGPVFAQSATGSIDGELTGPVVASGLADLTVEVVELQRQLPVGADGRFRIDGLAPGRYTLRIERPGATAVQRQVTVTAGEAVQQRIILAPPNSPTATATATAASAAPVTPAAQATPVAPAPVAVDAGPATPEVAVDPNAVDLDRIEVRGVRGALFEARALERDADNFKNIITADDAGQFADQNVAESTQRMPGVIIQRDEGEGRFVSIRGLDPDFTNVTLNGAELGTSEFDGRATALDLVPSDLLGRIEISKTVTPDMDGDAIGGTLDLVGLSAFEVDSGGVLRAEGSYSDYAGELNPKLSGSYARVFEGVGNGRLGLALTANYFERDILGDDVRGDEDGLIYVRPGTEDDDAECEDDDREGCFLRPESIDGRVEQGVRTRYGASLNLEYQTGGHELYIRSTASELEDNDVRLQSTWDLDGAGDGDEVLAVGPRSGTFDDADIRSQIFFQDRTEQVFTAALGGSSRVDAWQFDYGLNWSKNDYELPEGLRGRFRGRDYVVGYTATDTEFFIDAAPGVGRDNDPNDLGEYQFDQILRIDENRTDTIFSVNVDALREFEIGERPASIKFGVKTTRRDKDVNKDEAIGDPEDFGIDLTLADVPLYFPRTEIRDLRPMIELDFMRDLLRNSQGALGIDLGNTSRSDYTLDEDVDALYLMSTIELAAGMELIAGVRYEQTDFSTTGAEVDLVQFADDDVPDQIVVRPDLQGSNDYSNVLPSVHFNWELGEDVLFRAAWTNTIGRPLFEDAKAVNDVSTEQDDDGSFAREAEVGNPLLEPLESRQFDVSIAWYPNDTTYLYAGAFYKKLKNFFVTTVFEDEDVALIGYPVGNGTIDGGFDEVEIVLNGAEAEVRGLEFAYEQAFVFLPRPFDGLFLSANLTFIDSKARDPFIRNGAEFPLPNQADRIANLSVGYEDDFTTLRLSGTHRSEMLTEISSDVEDAFGDYIRNPYTTYDFNARFNFSDAWQLYFDVINITEERDERVQRGDRFGRFPGRIQDFGRTYQLGVRYQF